MEFPELGQHCSESSCNKLDFLPMKCDACKKIFCMSHFHYVQHNCLVGVAKDVQVPVCPLCNRPVPSKRGDPPDVAVSSHIDRECRSDPALAKRKAFTNRCSMKGCKQKELVPVLCGQCNLNHCLKHRHPDDHSCTGRGLSPSGAAAMARLQHRTTSSPAAQMMYRRTRATTQRPPASPQRPCTVDESCVGASVLQGNLTEDEALALALQQSLYEAEFPEDGSDQNAHGRRSQGAPNRRVMVPFVSSLVCMAEVNVLFGYMNVGV
ncbi:unnamed protein product [Ixodes persulcatus]